MRPDDDYLTGEPNRHGDPRLRPAPPSASEGTDGYTYVRERESRDTDRWLTAPDGPYMVVVMGERGAGRTMFVRDAASRRRAAGTAVLSVACVPGDGSHSYLLALRLVKVLEQHRFDTVGQRRPGNPVAGMLAAIEQGDKAVAAETVTAALTQPTATLVVLDDAQYADIESIWLLGTLDFGRTAPHVRLLASMVQRVGSMGEPQDCGSLSTACTGSRTEARRIELPPLDRQEVASVLAQRLRAAPDDALIGLVHRLSRGVPAAVDTLLAEWARKDAVHAVGGYALLRGGAAVPVLSEGDRFIEALYALGKQAVAVASALSVLWPLGLTARRLAAEVGGLSAEAVRAGLRDLVEAGIIDELPAPADGDVRGWIFRIPLVEHAVRERLGPLDRSNLARAAVEALWAAGAKPGGVPGGPAAAILEEADADTYLPDRIVEAGALVDRERAVAELVAAAERTVPEPGCGSAPRWLSAAAHLVEEPDGRLILKAATYYAAICDHSVVQRVVEALLRGDLRTGDLTDEMLQEAVCLLVGAASAAGDLAGLSRMAEARWWNTLGSSAAARASGRALALCALGRWQEALAVPAPNARQGSGADAAAVLPTLYRTVAEMTLGRPERFRRSLTMPEFGALSAGSRYAVTVIQVDQLLGLTDLRAAADLLAERRVAVDDLPVHSRFLWRHLEGRWEEAMRLGRQLFANRQSGTPALGHHLFPERITALLFARGRIRTVVRLVGTMREDLGGAAEYEHILCRAEAEAARTLGDLAEAERTLRHGLNAARAGGEVYATDELWAELATVQADTGDLPGALDSLRHLERIASRTDGERTRLLWLLASARLLGADSAQVDTAHKQLLDAVALARRRGQPFETAVTLLAAARQDEDPAAMLSEAYELFGDLGALLWRFRARADMRRAGLAVPGRGLATAENEHLLAILVSDGMTNRQVASVLGLSQDAVANRLTRLFARTGVRSRTEFVTAAMRSGGASAQW